MDSGWALYAGSYSAAWRMVGQLGLPTSTQWAPKLGVNVHTTPPTPVDGQFISTGAGGVTPTNLQCKKELLAVLCPTGWRP